MSPSRLAASLQVAGADPAISYGNAMSSGSPVRPDVAPAPVDVGGTPVPAPTDRTLPAAAEQAEAAAQSSPAAPMVPATSDITGAVNIAASTMPEPGEQSSGLVDLNTGSFEDLNALEGVGPIGRAIIRGRPYASTEELVSKKVLRRSIYEKIKDQVTVQ